MYVTGSAVEAKCPKARKWVKGTVVEACENPEGEINGYTIAKASGIEITVPLDKVREIKGKHAAAMPKKDKKVIGYAKTGIVGSDEWKKDHEVELVNEILGDHSSLSGQLHDDFQVAFDWFNKRLFDGKLSKPFWVTIRKANALAHYGPKRWASQDKTEGNKPVVVDEISINPDYMLLRGVEDLISSVVHEMFHQWQFHYGENKSRKGYHNKEWGDAMEAVGLIPSSTGQEGGDKVGQSMDHYIVDGTFRTACKELLDSGFAVRWAGAVEAFHGEGAAYVPGIEKFGIEGVGDKPKPKTKKQTRAKFTCGKCEANAWAKPGAALMCGICRVDMAPAGT